MSQGQTTAEFVNEILIARQEWEAVLANLGSDAFDHPIVGEWSAKDVMAHLLWHEREMLNLIRARKFVGSAWWSLPLHDRNRLIWEVYRHRSPQSVREEELEVYTALIEELAGLEDADLNEASHWPGMPADWLPRELIAGNTSEHFRDHASDLARFVLGDEA